jgi:hypothetical protein
MELEQTSCRHRNGDVGNKTRCSRRSITAFGQYFIPFYNDIFVQISIVLLEI